MPRKQPAAAPHGPRIRDERQKLVRELIAKARRLLDATPDDRHEPAEELVRELIDTALFSLDLADVRWGTARAEEGGPSRADSRDDRRVRVRPARRPRCEGCCLMRVATRSRLACDSGWMKSMKDPAAGEASRLTRSRDSGHNSNWPPAVHFVLADCGN